MTVGSAKDTIKNYFGTLWNTYAFFVLYADIDNFDPSKYSLDKCQLSVMDKWVLSEFNKLVETVTEELDKFNCTDSSRQMQKFVDNLSNWYIRRCRKRFWVGGFTEDKKAAYMTLWTILTEYAKLSAPFTPFISETIYLELVKPFFKNAPESIHLVNYPKVNRKYIDEELSASMNLTYAYTELGRSARNTFNLKIRQPLATLYLTDARNETALTDEFIKILKEELNVKQIIQNSNLSQFVSYSLKPQLKTVGPKYGKLLGGIKQHLDNCDADAVVEKVKSGASYKFEVNGQEIELTEQDLLIHVEQKEGYASASEDGLSVIFDKNLTEELINEGLVREFVSKVQALRKASGLEVIDRIKIEISGDDKIEKVIIDAKDVIATDVLAVEIKKGNNGMNSEEFDLNGEKVICYITKA